jgi:hypothetical protein
MKPVYTFLSKCLYSYLLIGILSPNMSWAQAPENDECTGAIEVFVDEPSRKFDVKGATQSMPGCIGTANNDIWFKFTPTSSYLIIAAQASPEFNAVIQLFSGNCGNLKPMGCAFEVGKGQTEKLPINHYEVGKEYFFRVYDRNPGWPATTDFNLQVYTSTPPENDFCQNATPIIFRDYCQNILVNNEGATGSGVHPSCANGSHPNDDLWFSFVPTGTKALIRVHASHNYRAVIEAFDACGGKPLVCGTTSKHNMALKLPLDNLTPGQTYYFRVYNFLEELSKSFTFTLCVYDPPVPENDECDNAISLEGHTELVGTLDGATASQGHQAPCSGDPNDDIWFSFKANAKDHLLEIFPSSGLDVAMQVFDACNGNEIGCVNTPKRFETERLQLNNLTRGANYLVRVYNAETLPPTTPDFRIVSSPGNYVADNNDCQNAISLIEGVTVGGSLDEATASGTPNHCLDTDQPDLWFKYTPKQNKDVNLWFEGSENLESAGLQVLDGCNGNEIICVQSSKESTIPLTELRRDQTYYVRVLLNDEKRNEQRFHIRIQGESIPTGITHHHHETFKIFPVPTDGIIHIELPDYQHAELQIADLRGQIFFHGKLSPTVNLAELPEGIYLLKIIQKNKIFTSKVVKK